MRKLLFLEFRNREQSVSYVLITIRFQSLKFDLIVDEMKHTIFSGFFSLVQKYPISKHNPRGSLNQKFHSSSHDIRKYIIFLIPCTLQQSIEALVEICLPRKRRKNIGICAVTIGMVQKSMKNYQNYFVTSDTLYFFARFVCLFSHRQDLRQKITWKKKTCRAQS